MTTRIRHHLADATRGVRSSPNYSKWLAVLLCSAIFGISACADHGTKTDVQRVVALSDIHGAYDAFVATLQQANVIDERRNWSGGDTHLVITGDLLDRGPDSRKVMDLVMRLESESALAGGRVHQLLGNHEVMNLIGDLRYVADEEFASYIDFESADEREYWFQHHLEEWPGDTGDSTARDQFEELAPPGFFGHRRAFRADEKYGKWLFEKPFAVVINETLFVHGGVPALFSEFGLEETNSRLKRDLRLFVDARQTLEDSGTLSPTVGFRLIPEHLEDYLQSVHVEDRNKITAERLLVLSESPLHGPSGPTWYRGSSLCSPIVEGDRLRNSLQATGATRVVVGHTPTKARAVRQRLDGAVIKIDTGMLNSHYDGLGHALIISEGAVEVVNQHGEKSTEIESELPRVGFEFSPNAEAALESALSGGRILSVSASGPASKVVQIEDSGRTLYASFRSSSGEGSLPEVAAYRLDRLVGLEMVPVTVRREIGGQLGSLQLIPVDTQNETERLASDGGQNAHCRIDRQRGAMYVFDALINNNARSPSSMLYQSGDWRLILTDHVESFGAGRDSLSNHNLANLDVGNQWRQALGALNLRGVRAELGEFLSDRQIEDLLDRAQQLQNLATDQ